MLEIDVDVGRFLAFGRDEALEQEVDFDRVHRGYAERVADRRIGRRAASLAQNALRAGKMDNVVHGEKIGRILQLRDEIEFFTQHRRDFAGHAVRVAPGRPLPGQVLQMALRGLAGRDGFVGILIDQFGQRKAAGLQDQGGPGECLLMAGEQAGHFLG